MKNEYCINQRKSRMSFEKTCHGIVTFIRTFDLIDLKKRYDFSVE